MKNDFRWEKTTWKHAPLQDELICGPELGCVTLHIYHEEAIVELLAEARQLGPRGSLRLTTFETLFGLIAELTEASDHAIGVSMVTA